MSFPKFWCRRLSRKIENLGRVAAEVHGETGRTVIALPGDVRDVESCQRIVGHTLEQLGRVDILVNNSGGSFMFPFLDTPVDRFDNNMSLNLRGPYVLTQLAARPMAAQGRGRIVNVSSAAGVHGANGGAVYSAAKAGLQMLTKVVAAELGPKGIRCNAIAVGTVASEGALRAWARFGQDADSMGRRAALPRVGHPKDIAWGVMYFVSGMSAWVSGQTLLIDGGPSLGGAAVDE